MPLFVFRKLGLGEVKPTTISLQLANRSIKYPRGVIEDVLVKVDKFIFPNDFIVLDMDEDEEIPLMRIICKKKKSYAIWISIKLCYSTINQKR